MPESKRSNRQIVTMGSMHLVLQPRINFLFPPSAAALPATIPLLARARLAPKPIRNLSNFSPLANKFVSLFHSCKIYFEVSTKQLNLNSLFFRETLCALLSLVKFMPIIYGVYIFSPHLRLYHHYTHTHTHSHTTNSFGSIQTNK